MDSLPPNLKPDDYYDQAAADHAVDFIETYCTHVKGHTGRFTLEEWQKNDIIRPLFGWKRADGRRKYRTCYIEVPRKNGKSSLTAAIALYLLTATDEPGPEIISAAGDANQARIVFETATGMVKQSRTLSRVCRLTQYAIRAQNGFYKSISAEASTKHGFNCSGVIFDELHVCTRDLWDVLTTSVGARRQPLIIALTTAGHDRMSICYEQHEYSKKVQSGEIDDPSYLPVIYAADPEDNWQLEETWKKANPGYGTICQEDYFRDQLIKAQQSPSHVNTFKRLNLNVWTSGEDAWITDEEFMHGAEPLPDEAYLATLPSYAGLDLASTRDLTAYAQVWEESPEKYYLRVHSWCNAERADNKKLAEGVDYRAFEAGGHLTITPGNVTSYAHVEEFIQKQNEQHDLRAVAFDRKFATYIVPSLIDRGVNMVPFGQGYYEMSYPTKQMEMAYIAGQIQHDGNACLRWQMGCVMITRDPADNIKVTKNRNKGGQQVDGVVASIMAFGEMLKAREHSATLEVLPL